MKKLLITSFLALLFSASTIAGMPSITFEGKKITLEDTRASLIKKLGKPKSGNNTYSYWAKPNYSISATYSNYGLESFSVDQMRTTPTTNFIQVHDTKFYLGKTTLKSVVTQLKHGCFDLLDTRFNSNYSFIVRDGAEGEINVGLKTEYTNNSKSASLNKPIHGIALSYDELDTSEGCNY